MHPDDQAREHLVAPRAEPQWQRVLGLLLVLFFAAMSAGLAFMFAEADARLGEDAAVADATVRSVSLGRHGSVVLTFTTADGREVRARTEDFMQRPEPEIGDSLRVVYDPEDPENYVRDERVPGHTPAVVIFGGASVFAVVTGVLAWRRGTRFFEFRRSGEQSDFGAKTRSTDHLP